MARPAVLLKRSLIFVHRWLGVALAVLFTFWFVSGIVMMYWTFPGVTAGDRLERLPVLDPAQIRVPVETAYAALGREQPPGQVRLSSFDGRPVYRFGGGGRRGGAGGGGAMVYADDGTVQTDVDDTMIDRAAVAWARQPLADAEKISVTEIDQWTVGSALRTTRPLYKYSWPDGQQVYVNGNTAEVGQYTTTESRFWAYLGAIPHWMYFTPLRKHQPQWLSFVVWSSLIGAGAALIGVVVAIWMLSPRKRYRYAGAPTSIPYTGWKRWHTVVGLIFGVTAMTWAFSGALSMGPFPLVDRITEMTVPSEPRRAPGANRRSEGANAQADAAQRAATDEGETRGRGRGRGGSVAGALRGRAPMRLATFTGKPAPAALASLHGFDVKELEYTTFDGQPIYVATNGQGETRIVPVHGEARASFGVDEVMQVVRRAAGPELADLRVMHEYDRYYLDRHNERPLPVVVAHMNDAVNTRYYISPLTATVVGSYSARNWINRWMYHGLHSLDFPWLYKYRPLWDIVVITLMLGGTALCVTSLVLTYKVLARKLAAVVRARVATPNDDLALES